MSDNEQDTLDRDEHLENLLRDTLRGRAATVHDGPDWMGHAGPTRRHTWLTVAAAVVVVAAVAAGLAVWRAGSNSPTPVRNHRAAHVHLPPAWHAALQGRTILVDGKAALAEAVTPSGAVVASEMGTNGNTTITIVDTDGSVRTLYRAPAQNYVTSVRTDGRWVVFAVGPVATSPPTNRIPSRVLVIDLRANATHTARDITATALPKGYVHASSAISVYNGRAPNGTPSTASSLGGNLELVDGVVYFIAAPPTRSLSAVPAHGGVIAYTPATGADRIVDRATTFDSNGDPRGVLWAGGRALAKNVPNAVPPLRTRPVEYGTPAHDGSTWAWNTNDTGTGIGWTDGDSTRTWNIDLAGKDADARLRRVAAVSGPYVFLLPNTESPGNLLVLDTRTGGYVDTGLHAFKVSTGGNRVAIDYAGERHGVLTGNESVTLDMDKLPGLYR